MDLFTNNFLNPLGANSKLNNVIEKQATRGIFSFPRNRTSIELGNASVAASLGGGYEYLFFDECKEIKFAVVAAMLPTLMENYGIRCSSCKYTKHGGKVDYYAEDFNWICPICHKLLIPWQSRAIFSSNAKILTGNPEYDWFPILCNSIGEKPVADMHYIYADSAASMNPDYNKQAKASAIALIERIPGLEHYSEAEFKNVNNSPGDSFLNEPDLEKLFKKGLYSKDSVKEKTFFYLDTARFGDKIVLFGWIDSGISRGIKPWIALEQCHLSIWDPSIEGPVSQKRPNNKGFMLDEDKLEATLLTIFAGFPNLIGVWLDARGHVWVLDFIKRFRTNSKITYGSKFRKFTGNDSDRDLGWSLFYDKAAAGHIDLIYHERYDIEFAEATWTRKGRKLKVSERSGSHNQKSRSKKHLELTDAVAISCLLANNDVISASASLVEIHKSTKEIITKRKGGNIQPKNTLADKFGVNKLNRW
ncbi:MAG: hypothetical protein HC877_20660 [Thioploca sp.]|nr:hypothetical protein [Thioploca sp.]